MKKTTMVLLATLVGLLMIGAIIYTSGQVEWEDGAPELNIALNITKVSPTTNEELDKASTSFDVNEDTTLPLIGGAKTLSTVEVGIPFVDPAAHYIIEWEIEGTANPQSPAVTTVSGTCSIFGDSATREYIGARQTSIDYTITSFKGNWDVTQPHTFLFPESTAPTQYFDRIENSNTAILGSDLHNSEFNITLMVEATGDPTIWGSTSVDIILKVGAGGNIEVEITGITAIVTEQ